jgi:hypothetical protein
LKNTLLAKNMKEGTIVTKVDVPFMQFQIVQVRHGSVTIRQINSKQDHEIPVGEFLLTYRYFYHSKFIVEAE